MSLQIVSITPSHQANTVNIDSRVTIVFNQEIDLFTIQKGINFYVYTDAAWTGPELSLLDTSYNDVLDIGETYTNYLFSYILDGNTLTLTTDKPLIPNKKHFITIVPGNDVSRFLSSKTVSTPEYTRIGTSTGEINICSAYTGTDNATLTLDFTSDTQFSLRKGLAYIDDFTFEPNVELDLGEVKISINGSFEAEDVATIDCFKADGVTSIFKIEFTTTDLLTVLPLSERIEDQIDIIPLQVLSTIPENLSIDNSKCNPVIIKFNKDISLSNDLISKIKITKSDMYTGKTKNITFTPVVSNNILKLYLTGTE